MLFFSRNEKYKKPFGAVRAGQPVTLNLYPNKNLFVTEAYLAVEKDGGQREYFTFHYMGEKDSEDIFQLEYIPKESGLYWYHMEVNTHFGPRYIEKGAGSRGILSKILKQRFQLTVTEPKFTVPEWFGEGITYNIFPDRFARSKMPKKTGYRSERVMHKDWSEMPEYLPNAKGEILNHDFFGGSFRGIEEKLPYLAELKVKTIYLNPIFEAASNHRYDTGDYKKPDPMLGTEEDFRRLCRKAKKLGIHIILDGVFSHTGFDSRYFGGRGSYDDIGAFQSKKSPYYNWYSFTRWPEQYSCWWGIYTLPQVNEMESSYMDYILNDEDSVVRHWMRLGVSGWRLDVADELPDAFIVRLREVVKEENPEGLVLGEVWEDASNKISYDVRRQYFQGRELDSVTNYPLRDGIYRFLKESKGEEFRETVENIMENYPREIFHSLMNIIGTHDTLRALTSLGAEAIDFQMDKIRKSQFRLSKKARRIAKARLKLAAMIQFSMPGSPCIYYGDEAGMEGFEDPFNRATYPWGKQDMDILGFYRHICRIYESSEALKKGNFRFISAKKGVLVFERQRKDDIMIIIINGEDHPVAVKLPFLDGKGLLTTIDCSGKRVIIPPLTGEWISY